MAAGKRVPGLLLDVHAPQGALNPVFSSLQPRAICHTNPVTVMQLRKTNHHKFHLQEIPLGVYNVSEYVCRLKILVK